jgi:isochorismate hydrolase
MKKEIYFTSETIKTKSEEMTSALDEHRHRHSGMRFQPEQAALLILDMQEFFLHKDSHAYIPSATAIIPGLNGLIAAFEKAQRPVIATRHLNTNEDAGMMVKWWRDLIKLQTAYSHYGNTVKIKDSIQISKTQYDAFYLTELEDTLHKLGVTQLIVCGVMTHLCCETTARSAFMRGFEVFFTVDGTATYNEELHRASLMTLSHGFAVPVLIEELLQTMDSNED